MEDPYVAFGVAALACFAITVFVVSLSWLFVIVFWLPRMEETMGSRMFICYSLFLIGWALLRGLYLIPAALWSSALTFLAILRNNMFYIFALTLVCTGGYVWLDYHPTIVSNYLYFRQSSRPVVDLFLLPVINILRMIYDAFIPVVNFWTNLYAFYEYGLPITLFKCGLNVQLANIFNYGADFLYAVFFDFNVFFSGDFFHDQWNIMNSLNALGLVFDTYIPILDCLCLALNFFWVYLTTFFQLQSLHLTLNFVWNWFISVIQLCFNIILDLPAYPDFTNITLNACGAIESAGDTFEDWVFLTGETGWGVLTNLPNLPLPIAQVLSVHYTQIITHPLCGIVKLGNMTAVAIIHTPAIFASDGSGVQYFQFGIIADELRVAVLATGAMAGAIYGLFDDSSAGVQAVQAFTSQLGLAFVDVLAFFFEWVPGNIFYFQFGGPLPATWGNTAFGQPVPIVPSYGFASNFLRYYFVDYYLKAVPLGPAVTLGGYTYASSLSQFFTDIVLTDQALGNLIGLINDPFGQFVRYLFDAFWSLLKAGSNFVSFIYCILTFNCDLMPITFRNVDFDVFFNSLYYLAGAAGDIVRQFDPDQCAITITEDQKNIVCCTGNFIEKAIDTAVLFVQQITHFVQDLLTLPTFQVHLCIYGIYTPTNITQCVRIPNFNTALYELKTAICDFTCALVGIIPTTSALQCVFNPVPPPASGKPKTTPPLCAKAQTCISNELCAVLQLFVLPLDIINVFFIKVINGQTFTGFIDFLVFSFNLILGQLALVIDRFGYMIDCLICAFGGTHFGCSPILYQVLSSLTILLRSTAQIFTRLLLEFVKLFLSLLIGMFGGGNPIKSLVDFIVGFATEIFGGLGPTIIDFLTSLLDAVGLGFLGAFIKILWQGFCPLLQIILNVFIGILNLITFGAFSIKQANFCCSGGNCTMSGGTAKRSLNGVEFVTEELQADGTLWFNTSQWVAVMLKYWPADAWSAPCAVSMPQLAARDWYSLSSDDQGEIEFCMFAQHWGVRTDGQYSIGNSTCDDMVMRYASADWKQIDDLKRFTIRDCLRWRLATEGIRNMTNQSWIPQDLFTNMARPFYLGMDMVRGAIINYQYMSDQQKPVAIVVSADYQQYWAGLGLSTVHYRGVITADDVAAMRLRWRLCDYFDNNGAANCQAVKVTATAIWGFLGKVTTSIAATMQAMSDDEVDPSVYTSYNYSLDNQIPVAIASLSGIMRDMFQLVTTFTSYWSDEANYKKREDGTEQAKLAFRLAVNESRRQFRLMAEEFWYSSIHASELRANQCGPNKGECDPAERERAHQAYEDAIHGRDAAKGETSMIYKLSQWWKRASFQTYAIKNPRYGTNRSTYGRNGATLQYRHANGSWVNETMRERAWRIVSLANAGTPAAQRRWGTLWRLWHKFKQSAYKQVLRHHYQPELVEQVKVDDGRRTLLRSRNPSALSHEIVCDKNNHCEVLLPQSMRAKTAVGLSAAAAPPPEPEPDQGSALRTAEFTSLLFRTADIFDITCYTNITINCVPPLVCNATQNTTTLCAQCLYLDQLIGRVTAALDQLLTHYTGGAFAQQVNLTVSFFNYCFDTNARVIVGNSANLSPQEFPRMGDGTLLGGLIVNSDYVDDPTPKIGFSDITDAINAALNATNATSNYTLQMSTSDDLIDTIVTWFITTVFFYLVPTITRLFELFSTDALFDAGESVFYFLIDWFLLCDWLVGDDYSGANKRFSIGQTLCMYVFTTLIVTYVSTVAFGVNVVSFITGTSLSLLIFFATFLSIYSNWAALCAPGLPVILMDDTLYFLAFSAFPKCSWFWGFQIKEQYTNDNCYAPRVWTCWHCRNEVGFVSFIDNVVFVVQQHFPQAWDFVRDSATPLYILYQIPWVNQKLDQFLGINFQDPVVAARYYGCNWITTITFNFLNATYFLIVFYLLLYPLSTLGIALVGWVTGWLFPLFLVIFYMFLDLVFMLGSTPYDRIEDPPPESIVPSNSPAQAGFGFGARFGDEEERRRRKAAPFGVKQKPLDSLSSANKATSGSGAVNDRVVRRGQQMLYKTRDNRLGLGTLRNMTARLIDNWIGDRKNR